MGVQILDGGDIHLGDHADGAYRLGNDTAGCTGTGDTDPHERPDQTRNGTDQEDDHTEQIGDGLGHDIGGGEKGKGNCENRADQGAQNGDGHGLQQQIRHVGVSGAEHQLQIGMRDAADNAFGHLTAGDGETFKVNA